MVCFAEDPNVAVSCTWVVELTAPVVMRNETPVEPAGTVTVAGTVTDEVGLDRETTSPPGPAG